MGIYAREVNDCELELFQIGQSTSLSRLSVNFSRRRNNQNRPNPNRLTLTVEVEGAGGCLKIAEANRRHRGRAQGVRRVRFRLVNLTSQVLY